MRGAFAGGACALVVALGACGSPGTAARSRVSAFALVSSAPDRAAKAGTARASGSVDVSADGRKASTAIEGVMDLESGAAELTIDGAELGLDGFGEIDLRMVDGTIYMNLGSLVDRDVPAALRERPWVRVDVPDGAQAAQGARSFGDQLQALRGVGDVRRIGTEEVRGTPTTRFKAKVDTRKALRMVGADGRERVARALRMFGGTMPVEVWLDADGVPRRFRIDVKLDVAGKSVRLVENIEFHDFGVEVDVSAPPADEVMSMAELRALGAD